MECGIILHTILVCEKSDFVRTRIVFSNATNELFCSWHFGLSPAKKTYVYHHIYYLLVKKCNENKQQQQQKKRQMWDQNIFIVWNIRTLHRSIWNEWNKTNNFFFILIHSDVKLYYANTVRIHCSTIIKYREYRCSNCFYFPLINRTMCSWNARKRITIC